MQINTNIFKKHTNAIEALFATTDAITQVFIGAKTPDTVSWQQATKTKFF